METMVTYYLLQEEKVMKLFHGKL